MLSNEQRLRDFIAERALQREQCIAVSDKGVVAYLRAFRNPLTRLRSRDAVLYNTHAGQVIWRHHEWRMRSEDHLMFWREFFGEVSE